MSRIRIYGDTSGHIDIKAPDEAGNTEVVIPEGGFAGLDSPTFTGNVDLPVTTDYNGEQLSTTLASKVDKATAVTLTPTFNNLTLGNGSVVGYVRVINAVIIYWGRLILGSTSSITGDLELQPYGSLQRGFASFSPNSVSYLDSGTRQYLGIAQSNGTDFEFIHSESGNGGLVNATNPFTWSSGDRISWTLVYEGAAP